MADPGEYDDQGPMAPDPPGRVRRGLTIALLITLIVSMVYLAFVSGRGVVPIEPVVPPRSSAQPADVRTSRLAIVDSRGRLTTTDATGGSVFTYGKPGIAFSFPAWSPDGSRIAAVGESAGESAIYVFIARSAATPGSDPVVVYRSRDRAPFYLYWAPDGRQLSFLTTEPDGLALRIAPADGSTVAVPIRVGSPMYWAWVDPARMLVHSGGDGLDAFFGEAGLDGIFVEPTTIESGAFRAPAVTSDGRFRAYVAPLDGTTEQVVVETRDRSKRHAIAVFGAAAIDFGPTTSELAFIAPAEAGREVTLPIGLLRLLDAPSGGVRTLLAGSTAAFFWAPDGRTIAALQIAAPGDTVAAAGRISLAMTTLAPWLRASEDATTPGLALRLVFIDVESGAIRSQRAVRVSDTFAQLLLPYFDQYALSHRLWSADGRSLVLPLTTDDGTGQIVVIPADGSDSDLVADGVTGTWSP